MVTVVNNPGATERERVVEVDRGGSAAGWAVAVIILLAIIAGGAYVWTHRAPAQQTNTPSASIQVNLPSGDTSGTGGNATQPNTQ